MGSDPIRVGGPCPRCGVSHDEIECPPTLDDLRMLRRTPAPSPAGAPIADPVGEWLTPPPVPLANTEGVDWRAEDVAPVQARYWRTEAVAQAAERAKERTAREAAERERDEATESEKERIANIILDELLARGEGGEIDGYDMEEFVREAFGQLSAAHEAAADDLRSRQAEALRLAEEALRQWRNWMGDRVDEREVHENAALAARLAALRGEG